MSFSLGNKTILNYIMSTVDSLFNYNNTSNDNKELSLQRRNTLLKHLNKSEIGLETKKKINKDFFVTK